MRNIMLLFTAGCLLLGSIHVHADAPSIRAMSYNIRYNNPDDGENAWPHRKEQVATMIGERHEADLAGLQEVLYGQLQDLMNFLPDHYKWVGVGRDDGFRASELTPIFYHEDKFELIATNTFWLSKQPEIPGSVSWDSALTRICTWAHFRSTANDRKFYLFNTHFDHRGEEARAQSAALIWRKIDKIAGDAPVVVTGDFNFPESSRPYAIITGEETLGGKTSQLKDARYTSENGHQGPTSSFNNWEELREPETRIDYIFTHGGVTTLNHHILDDKFDGRFPSDHLPVLAEIKLPNGS